MGVAKDVVATISNLAYWMAKERSEDSLRELRKLKELLPEPAREEAEEVFDAMEMFLKEGQFDDAWEQYEVLADIVTKYVEDPPQELEVGGTPQAKLEALLESLARISDILVSVYDIEIKGIEEAETEIEDAIEDIEKHIRFLGIYDEIAASFGEIKSAFEKRDWNALVYASSKLAWRIVGKTPTIAEIIRDPPLTTNKTTLLNYLISSCMEIIAKHDEEAISFVDLLLKEAKKIPRLREVIGTIEDIASDIKNYIRAGEWDKALDEWRILASIIQAYDPPLTTWLPEETYEGYEKAAKIVGETKSRYAREVLEGRRTPVEPPNGIKARERAERMAKPEEKKVEWEKIIEEAEKPTKADWEKVLEEVERPTEADWEKELKEYD